MELLKMVLLYMMEILTLAFPPLMAMAAFLLLLRSLRRSFRRLLWRARRWMGRLLRMLVRIFLFRS